MSALQDLRIVVVDDDPVVCRLLTRGLHVIGGATTIGCASVAEAQQALAHHGAPDVLITDLNLGKQTSKDLLDWMQARPDMTGVICISMTVHSEQWLPMLIPDNRFAAMLTKPIQLQRLIELIPALITRSRSNTPH